MVEILGGEPHWERDNVTCASFLQNEPIENVLNTQMIHDIEISSQIDKTIHIHIPRPVMQRLMNGKTKGLAFYPLGSLQATFYLGHDQVGSGPRLYYNLE